MSNITAASHIIADALNIAREMEQAEARHKGLLSVLSHYVDKDFNVPARYVLPYELLGLEEETTTVSGSWLRTRAIGNSQDVRLVIDVLIHLEETGQI